MYTVLITRGSNMFATNFIDRRRLSTESKYSFHCGPTFPSTESSAGNLSVSDDHSRLAVTNGYGTELRIYHQDTPGVWTLMGTFTSGVSEVRMSGDGNVVVTSNSAYTGVFPNEGALNVYRWNGIAWEYDQLLQSSDTAENHLFGVGFAVSYDGSIVVGGSAITQAIYVFAESAGSYSETAILEPTPEDPGSKFGNVVEISGDGQRVIVGAYQDDFAGVWTGAVYMYVQGVSPSVWSQEAQITPTTPGSTDNFGRSVDINYIGDVIVIGSPQDDGAGSNDGKAFVYTRSGSTWTESQVLTSSADLTNMELFGMQCSISSNGLNILVTDAGSVGFDPGIYFFKMSEGSYVQYHSSPNGEGYDTARNLEIKDDGSKFYTRSPEFLGAYTYVPIVEVRTISEYEY